MTGDRKRRVVMSGAGLISALSPDTADTAEFWRLICAGTSGVSKIEQHDVSELPVRIAAEVKDFSPDTFIRKKDSRLMDRFLQFGVVAAELAVRDAGLTVGQDVASDRVGIIIGSGIGGAITLDRTSVAMHTDGIGMVSPYVLPMVLTNMVAAQVAIRMGVTGPSMGITNACTTGANAIGEGLRAIQRGEADVMICGASEAGLHPMGIASFAVARALSRRNDEPERASRPFDRRRDGFVLGEGAGVVVLESFEHARARGATPRAELLGYGTSTDAYHVTLPDPGGAGAAACMRRALLDAGLAPSDVDYVNAHATGTRMGDVSEARAIRDVFGGDMPACSATKSMTGHLLGAAGVLGAVIAAYSTATDTVPPTINLDDPDPECELNHVRGAARETPVRAAIANSFAFGGHNATLVFGKS
jgi:3-oxoacyl-[acyl-carrier-protein] synthase II